METVMLMVVRMMVMITMIVVRDDGGDVDYGYVRL